MPLINAFLKSESDVEACKGDSATPKLIKNKATDAANRHTLESLLFNKFNSEICLNTIDPNYQEDSVGLAGGLSGGAMVARYTRALSGELAVEEFQRSWLG